MLRVTIFLPWLVSHGCKQGIYNHKLPYHKPSSVVESFFQPFLFVLSIVVGGAFVLFFLCDVGSATFDAFAFHLVEFLILLFIMPSETYSSSFIMSQFSALITCDVFFLFLMFSFRWVRFFEIYQIFVGIIELVSFQVSIVASNE